MKISETIVVVSGGFDPIHSGHLRMFEAAKKLGDRLIVAVNSDDWLTRKTGRPFMPLCERYKIVQALHMVYDVELDFDDSDGSSVQALINIKRRYPTARIIFANGGDRTKENIPEMSVSGIEFKFGVGGEDKANSSSWILQEWKTPKTLRPWGYYRILHENGKEVKVKELTVEPGQRLSMQRHKDRAEHWFVAEGSAEVYTVNRSTDYELMTDLEKFESTHIANETWHQLCNTGTTPLKIIEIQYGENCVEEDIERKD